MMESLNRPHTLNFRVQGARLRFLLVIVFLGLLASQWSIAATETIEIYGANSKALLGVVPASSRSITLEEQQGFDRVQFVKPTVKGWVSEEFVEFQTDANGVGFIKVDTDVLNFRVQPSRSSLRITQLYRNHTSRVLQRRDGFVQIFAPASLVVLVANLKSSGNEVKAPETPVSENSVGTAVKATMQSKEPEVSANVDDANSQGTLSQASTHLIAPGDAISLLVFGEADLSLRGVRVPQSGSVSFPLIGAVEVVGKTTADIERELEVLLSKGYVKNPKLSVSIFSYRPIFIRGEVISTGSFPYNEGLTVAKAIALAGGVKPSAKELGISLMRDGKIIAQDLSVNSLQVISSGDVVSVAADKRLKEAESAFIYLHGEVAVSGEYEFRPGLTVEKAVVLAGGFTLRASKRKIDITRYEALSEDGAPAELRRVKLYTPVKPGDVIRVGASWF